MIKLTGKRKKKGGKESVRAEEMSRLRAGWATERGKFIILMDGTVHCLINTALSSSFLSSPPFYDT